MSAVLFFIAAIGALAGAIGVVTVRNPFYAVLCLVSHLVALAALFLLLRAEFVAAAQVVVYAGAVMVLYVFVVAYVGGDEVATGFTTGAPLGGVIRVLGPLFALALAIELCIALLGTALRGVKGKGAPYHYGFGFPAQIGQLFLTKYLFPFEIASLLLMVAAIGAVVLARRRRGLETGEEEPVRARVRRPLFTGTLAEASGMRRAPGDEVATAAEIEPVRDTHAGEQQPAEEPGDGRGAPEPVPGGSGPQGGW